MTDTDEREPVDPDDTAPDPRTVPDEPLDDEVPDNEQEAGDDDEA